ncbi:MAG TPA: hypothetical protein VGJ18_14290 [Gemmatimonadaceae bacterium]|jgi:hypothetical protein
MDEELRREVIRLRRTTRASLLLLLVVSASAFWQARGRTTFDEIDVQRINVKEPDGKLRLTISNHARLPDPIIGGKAYPLRSGTGVQSAGLIFFNDDGNENGGLIWTGHREGQNYNASETLTFDQFDQDETMTLGYGDENRRRMVGLTVLDRSDESIQPAAESLMVIRAMPDGPAKQARMKQFRLMSQGLSGAPRLFAGKELDKSSMVTLSDRSGHARLRLLVDSLGTARIDFLDETGRVTRTLTGVASR